MKEELREGLREAEVKNILFLKIRAGGGLVEDLWYFTHSLSVTHSHNQTLIQKLFPDIFWKKKRIYSTETR